MKACHKRDGMVSTFIIAEIRLWFGSKYSYHILVLIRENRSSQIIRVNIPLVIEV